MDIKIIEPIKNYLKEFNSIEEFNNFYSLNKDELNQMTTHKLNKMYNVKGYRITKIKGELMLKKWDENNKRDEEELLFDKLTKNAEEMNNRFNKNTEEINNRFNKNTEEINDRFNKNTEEINLNISKIKITTDEKLKKYQEEINGIKNDISNLNDEILEIKDDIKKIKLTMNDVINFINNNLIKNE